MTIVLTGDGDILEQIGGAIALLFKDKVDRLKIDGPCWYCSDEEDDC